MFTGEFKTIDPKQKQSQKIKEKSTGVDIKKIRFYSRELKPTKKKIDQARI